MKDEEINEIIAITQGWDMDPPEAYGWESRGKWCKSPSGEMLFVHAIPNYCNDLNAMREARKSLTLIQACQFWKELHAIVKRRCAPNIDDDSVWMMAIDALANERAEAFLRTLGKWQEPATHPKTRT